jgi:hypothetical protein
VDIFYKSGVLETAVDDWAKKPQALRTLANCELHFIAANHLRTTKLSTATNATLSANVAQTATTSAPTSLERALTSSEVMALIAKVTAEAVANATRGQTQRNTRPNSTRLPRAYCWSHGSCAHASKDCRAPREGHQPNATLNNKMGGSTKGIQPPTRGNQENTNPNGTS